MHALKVIISFIFAFYFVPLHPLTYSNGIMRVTYYDKDGKVTETKDFGDKASDVVLNYDDTKLFFQIPESIIKSARSTKDKLERLYLLEQLRFLIEYDYELYTKSELCDKQDVEMSCYLRDIGCKDIEGMKPTQSDNDSNYQPNPVFAEMRDRLFRHATNLSDIRHRLINTTKRNNIQYSRIVRDPLSKDSCYNQVYLYSDELTPEVCYLLSLLAPLGDISEKQIYEESLFKDNKFLLSIARALYRTNGINRSVLYNLLRLFMPIVRQKVFPTSNLNFAAGAEIKEQNDIFVIDNVDDLDNVVEHREIRKSELASIFCVELTDNSLLYEIKNLLCNEFKYYSEREKNVCTNELKREMIKNFYEIKKEYWSRLLGKRFEMLENEFYSHCNEGNLYASPYCLYRIVLRYEVAEELSEITEPLTKDVIFCYSKNHKLDRIQMYKQMFSLNLIKSMISGISIAEMQNKKTKQMEDGNTKTEAIHKAIEYIRPIFTVEFLNNKKSPQTMEDTFIGILNIDKVKERICEIDLKKFKEFNMRMILNIIGLLIDERYFRNRTATSIDKKLQEVHPEHGQRKDEILLYNAEKSTYSYIKRKGLIPIIKEYLATR